jgi:hypothetical protein
VETHVIILCALIRPVLPVVHSSHLKFSAAVSFRPRQLAWKKPKQGPVHSNNSPTSSQIWQIFSAFWGPADDNFNISNSGSSFSNPVALGAAALEFSLKTSRKHTHTLCTLLPETTRITVRDIL